MASAAMDYEAPNGDRYDGKISQSSNVSAIQLLTFPLRIDEAPRYERDNRSASPRPGRDEIDTGRRRSASPTAHPDRFVQILQPTSGCLTNSCVEEAPRKPLLPRTMMMALSTPALTSS